MKSFSLILLVVFLSACVNSPAVYKTTVVKEKAGGVCKVVVYPFFNESDYPLGGTILYRIFSAELLKVGGVDVVGEGDLRTLLVQRKTFPNVELSPKVLKSLKETFGVDGIILGSVLELKNRGPDGPVASFWVKMVDARTGKTLWYTYHSRKGGDYRKIMHFGVKYTITGLLKNMCREVLEKWREEGFGCY